MGNIRFYYSRTYYYREPIGHRRQFRFNLVEHKEDTAVFRPIDNGATQTYPAGIERRGDKEVARVNYFGRQIFLRADNHYPKGYLLESSTSCRAFEHPSEITEFVDEGKTGICPHCGINALIGSACGIKISENLLNELHCGYFTDNPTIRLTIGRLKGASPTPCSPYIWVVLNYDKSQCLAVDVSSYSEEDAPEKLMELWHKVGSILFH